MRWRREQAESRAEFDLATPEGRNDLVLYLVGRFIVVLLAVVAVESLVTWVESLLFLPVLRSLARDSPMVDQGETTSVVSLAQWLLGFIRFMPPTSYLQMTELAMRSLAVVLAIVMLLFLVLPPWLGALAFSRVVVHKVSALQQRRERELTQMDQQRSQFMTDVAHDLRSPLMAIAGMAHALSDDVVRDDALRDEYLRSICDKADRMGSLVSSVFDYAKLGGGSYALEREVIDLSQLLLREAAAAYADIEDASMRLTVLVSEERCPIDADPMQLARVVTNLLTNAVRHNRAGTEVALMLVRRAGVAHVVVADTGDPIAGDPEDLFRPFSRGDASRSPSGGSGLGLSICRRIAEMHGYDLTLVQPYGRFGKAFVLKCVVVG